MGKFYSAVNTYNKRNILRGHDSHVLCLAVAESGKLLASGGGDTSIIWSLDEMKELHRFSMFSVRGATTAITWVRRDDSPDEGFIYGTLEGYVSFCKYQSENGIEETHVIRLAFPSEITSIAYDTATYRLAIANREGSVALFSVSPSMMRKTADLWAIRIDNCIPKTIAFTSAKNIMVFGLHDAIMVLNASTGQLNNDQSMLHGIKIGAAACNATHNVFCVDTILGGAALYRMDDATRLKDLKVPRKKELAAPKQVALAEDCTAIVSGSDHGIVYVFDRKTGALKQKLRTRKDTWVQAITTTAINGVPAIIAGHAMSSSGRCDIFVFRKTWVHRVVYIFIVLFVSVLGVLGGKMAYTESKMMIGRYTQELWSTWRPYVSGSIVSENTTFDAGTVGPLVHETSGDDTIGIDSTVIAVAAIITAMTSTTKTVPSDYPFEALIDDLPADVFLTNGTLVK